MEERSEEQHIGMEERSDVGIEGTKERYCGIGYESCARIRNYAQLWTR